MDIIITLGPKTLDGTSIKDIKSYGATAVRYNFSHFDEELFNQNIKEIKEGNIDLKLIGDIQGSKIRVWRGLEAPMKLKEGDQVRFCSHEVYEDNFKDKDKLIPLNLNLNMFKKIKSKEISLKDGSIIIKVLKIQEEYVIGQVVKGGLVRGEKSCNIKGYIREKGALNNKDKKDIEYCIENEFDTIAFSYIEDKESLIKYKKYINKMALELSKKVPKIFAKIETIKGVKNIKEISEESDGIIIGRGDLVPEIGIENIPIAQRIIINCCKDKELIIATHVFNSISTGIGISPAEVNDIYWFIKSGVSGFMLAKETTISSNPRNAIESLNKLMKKYIKE
ncbi:pyruvate kinase [Clostridium intestinale]|uniref:Pyruvate kinase n=1 Tax=Clostridium intestinale DSM 6191 TaxID=1121320 RepID=A0A1M5WQX8_9CLOT|nr:pyruvate kinase [Clostridium intestinale]SHH89957.1 pyruvate kinase [Clostridium intestinale DSM 6191]